MTRPAMAIAAAAALLATGCSMFASDDRPGVAYRQAESVRSLEVPPDLTKPTSQQGLSLPDGGEAGGNGLLPEYEGMRFVRAGASAWLELEGVAPETVWPRVRGFLQAQGLTVQREEPELGIIETGWAERYDGPGPGGLTGWLSGLFGGGPETVRDRYQVRLERMDGGAGTRVFLAHRAAQEVADSADPRRQPSYAWARLAGDPAIEAEMTRRLLVHLGMSERRARGVVDDVGMVGLDVRYVETEGGVARVIVASDDYRRVFAQVGDALGRVGADIELAEREDGRYRVHWTPPAEVAEDTTGGFLGLFGGGEPVPHTLELHLRLLDGSVRVIATDADGARRSGPLQKTLLRRLAEAMGGGVAVERGQGGERPESEAAPPAGGRTGPTRNR